MNGTDQSNMRSRVIYLSCIPLTDKVARDWFVTYLVENSVDVEFWDISFLLGNSEVGNKLPPQASYVRVISDTTSLKQAIESNARGIYVLLLMKIWRFRQVFKLLTLHKCKTVAIAWGSMPSCSTGSRHSIWRIVASPMRIFAIIRNRLQSALLAQHWYIKPYDIVFAAGEAMLKRQRYAHRKIPIALCDFDQYFLALQKRKPLVEVKYAVFLDIYLPYHSDLRLVGMSPIDPERYYRELNHFFSALEDQHHIEIVIAAHPKATYRGNEFSGRKIFWGETPELVKDAELVVAHASTSVSYAVLNYKPLLFIFTDEMKECYKNSFLPHILSMASYLDALLVNISQLEAQTTLNPTQVKEERYDSYRHEFIVTDGLEGEESKKVFLKELLALSNHP